MELPDIVVAPGFDLIMGMPADHYLLQYAVFRISQADYSFPYATRNDTSGVYFIFLFLGEIRIRTWDHLRQDQE